MSITPIVLTCASCGNVSHTPGEILEKFISDGAGGYRSWCRSCTQDSKTLDNGKTTTRIKTPSFKVTRESTAMELLDHALNRALAEREAATVAIERIARLEEELSGRNGVIADLRKELAEKNDSLAAKDTTIDDLRADLSTSRGLVTDLEKRDSGEITQSVKDKAALLG